MVVVVPTEFIKHNTCAKRKKKNTSRNMQKCVLTQDILAGCLTHQISIFYRVEMSVDISIENLLSLKTEQKKTHTCSDIDETLFIFDCLNFLKETKLHKMFTFPQNAHK